MNELEWNLLENKNRVEKLDVAGGQVRAGDRVRLRPSRRADIFDLALSGKIAVIESIEQDYEGHYHICVVADEDPGRDIGFMRQPGHRFFFSAEEIEPLGPDDPAQSAGKSAPAILIAGIGNIFLGDDGFGVEVVRRLMQRELPAGAQAIDFGIRGLDLAYALLDGPGATILIDACPRGGQPGNVYVVSPDLNALGTAESSAAPDAHSMNPVTVLGIAKSMGGSLRKILLVGCEPATFGPEEGRMGLSEQVESAVDEAVDLVQELVKKIAAGEWSWDATQQT